MSREPWWRRLPERVLEEERALEELRHAHEPLVRHPHRWQRGTGEELAVVAQLVLGSRTVDLEVRFPSHYPEGCPVVRPVPYERLSSHQFVGGVLCLELGPDNWHPRYRVADMLRSAHRLLSLETQGEVEPVAIPSRHTPDLLERVRHAGKVLLVPPSFEERTRDASAAATFEFVWPFRNLVRVLPVSFPSGVALDATWPAFREEGKSSGLFVPLAEDASRVLPDEPAAFEDWVRVFGGEELATTKPRLLVVRVAGEELRGFWRLGDTVDELVVLPLETDGATRTPGPLRERLAHLRVGIVGLGSLGSKVAVSLARSGVRHFVFVDGDILLPGNVCRHTADFADIGATKVAVVKELVRDVATTEPSIRSYALPLGAATNPAVHAFVLDELGSADVLVDATADPDVFGQLAALASDRQRPLVWGEVFGGGLGGLVASACPLADPCPRCVRAGFLATASFWPPAPHARTVRPYEGTNEEPWVATDADVAFVAAAVTLRVQEVAEHAVARPTVALLGLRRGWIFEAPPQIVPVAVRRDDVSCARCWRQEEAVSLEDLERVEALLGGTDADDPSPP